MATTIGQARFDTRLPNEQKPFFEKTAMLGVYRNLTDFIVRAVQEKTKEIIKELLSSTLWMMKRKNSTISLVLSNFLIVKKYLSQSKN